MRIFERSRQIASRVLGRWRSTRTRHACPARWLTAEENPWRVPVLDCSELATTLISVTSDKEIAEKYMDLRTFDGIRLRETATDGLGSVSCDLRYPASDEIPDGALFRSRCMEEKWDIFHFKGDLYFCRSWTGNLCYKARVSRSSDGAVIDAVIYYAESVEADPDYSVASVDFLVRSHLFGLVLPCPLPESQRGKDEETLALWAVSNFGPYALYAAFGNTTGLKGQIFNEENEES